MNRTYDVIVVGSGPAGATAALQLARADLSVAVVEKAALPRYKTCGGGIIGRARHALPKGVQIPVEQECRRAELNFLDAGLHFETRRSEPIVHMTMRSDFDFAILSSAQAAGAEIHQTCEATDVTVTDDAVRVVTRRGTMMSRFIIAADGALSTIARKAGWEDQRHLIPAVEWEVELPACQLDRFSGVARFDFGIVPHGYAWAFPKKCHLSVGVLATKRREIDLNRACMDYMRVIGCETATEIKRHGFLIPVRPRKGTLVANRIVLTGDAAGLADPLTAEGISFAIQSGKMAAQAVMEGKFDEAHVRAAYHRAMAQDILPELRAGRLLARLLTDFPKLRAWVFRRCGQHVTEAVVDVMSGVRRYEDLISMPRAC